MASIKNECLHKYTEDILDPPLPIIILIYTLPRKQLANNISIPFKSRKENPL